MSGMVLSYLIHPGGLDTITTNRCKTQSKDGDIPCFLRLWLYFLQSGYCRSCYFSLHKGTLSARNRVVNRIIAGRLDQLIAGSI